MEGAIVLLCDIGNTSYHFLEGEHEYKKDAESFEPESIKERVYFISVNTEVSQKLSKLENWVDLSAFVSKEPYYETMGIDRIFALEGLSNAVLVDAGSAITVDVVRDGVFEGGFIYPGIKAMEQTYVKISPALAYSFNFELNLDKMAKNSQDAISYGFLKLLYSEVNSHNLPIILTGGDAKTLHKILKNAEIDNTLIFRAMKKIIKEAKLC